ncbi:YkvA family protein [Spartinivicinus ruber]|uniref:YkvA family protein n=1 Tax=Spartinivicinus ruber TaxID=2683272 RepID=UPI0013D1DDB6|nr:YkvA family protein [Spartinivicinus ruber]
MYEIKRLPKKYESKYSEDKFWIKVKKYAKRAGESVLEPALKMYYALIDSDTPAWARAIIVGALGYFISPLDTIPDVIPAFGFTDDLSVLAAALATVAVHIKDEHVEKAKEKLKKWFSQTNSR